MILAYSCDAAMRMSRRSRRAADDTVFVGRELLGNAIMNDEDSISTQDATQYFRWLRNMSC